jgi:hypothetical protein
MSPTPSPDPAASVRLELEIQPGSEPIQGTVRTRDVVQDFTGWVALGLILEAALQEQSPSRSS